MENQELEHCREAVDDPCCDVSDCVKETYARVLVRERAAARKPLASAIRAFLLAYHEGDDDSVNDAIDKLTDLV